MYYNGTTVPDQLWTPLLLAEEGELIDPMLRARTQGLVGLQGKGKTNYLTVNTAFLLRVCDTKVKLGQVEPLLANMPTVFVAEFDSGDCASEQRTLLANFTAPSEQRANNPMPTLVQTRSSPESTGGWFYGVPGQLAGRHSAIVARSEQELGGRPQPIAGAVSRLAFVPLPIVEVDFKEIAFREKWVPQPKYPVSLLEAVHRGNHLALDEKRWRDAHAFVKAQLWPRHYPALLAALGSRFGGVEESYFELGLIQGIDIDNSGAFDFVGVARVGVVTKAGPWRWVDVVWSWRTALGSSEAALTVLRTSEAELYAPQNHYFSEVNPSLWAPDLVVSAFADFDKDKRMEVVTSLIRPVALAYQKHAGSGSTTELSLRDSAIHAWEPGEEKGATGRWIEVFKTVAHEARRLRLDPREIAVHRFGEFKARTE